MVKVSIIMPVYNVEKYIRASIDSVLSQTCRDFELIIVDDGSPDNCLKICDEYAEKDPRIRVIHKANGGLSSARNAGLEIAVGKYVYFIDSDDTIEPFTLEKSYMVAENTGADITVVGINVYNVIGGETQSITKKERPSMVLHSVQIEDHLCSLINNSMFNYAWDKLYRLSTIRENKICYNSFFDRVCEDTIFLYDLFPFINTIATVPECCYNYMIRDTQSVVKKFLPERFEKYMAKIANLQKIADSFSKEKNKQELRRIIDSQYASSVVWSINNMFHKDCNFGISEKYKYYKWMRSLDTYNINVSDSIKWLEQDTSRSKILLFKIYEHRMPMIMTILTQLLFAGRRFHK